MIIYVITFLLIIFIEVIVKLYSAIRALAVIIDQRRRVQWQTPLIGWRKPTLKFYWSKQETTQHAGSSQTRPARAQRNEEP